MQISKRDACLRRCRGARLGAFLWFIVVPSHSSMRPSRRDLAHAPPDLRMVRNERRRVRRDDRWRRRQAGPRSLRRAGKRAAEPAADHPVTRVVVALTGLCPRPSGQAQTLRAPEHAPGRRSRLSLPSLVLRMRLAPDLLGRQHLEGVGRRRVRQRPLEAGVSVLPVVRVGHALAAR